MGIGGGLIQSLANQGAFNVSPYVNPSLTGGFTSPPVNPYAPQGMGYGTSSANTSNQLYTPTGSNNMSGMEGRYEIKKMAEGGLAAAAQNMANKGRDGDSMLVHMSPGEVKGLQALAMAHGGSLSINPNTGLVEASFLKKILPTLAGVGLSFIPGVGPLAAAGLVGGFETLRTGDLSKGLMAGLGAYGGAGLASSLTAAGGQALATPEAVAGQLGVEGAATGTGSQAAMLAEQNAGFGTQGLESIRSAAATAQPTAIPQFDGSTLIGSQSMGPQAALPTTGQQLQAGIGQLGSEAGRSAVYNAMPTGTVPALGVTAANLATPEAPKPPGMPEEEEKYKGAPYRYSLSPNFSGYVPRQPQPYYRPAGLGYAAGGDVKKKESSPQLPTNGGDGFGQIANLTVNALEGRSSPNDPVARLVNALQGKFGSQPQAAVTGNIMEYQIDPRTGAVYVPRGLGYAAGGDVMMASGGAYDDEPMGDVETMAAGGVPGYANRGLASVPRDLKIGEGIARDTDEDTASLGAYDAAKKRMEKQYAAASLKAPAMPKAGIAKLGQIKPMAEGGLGGYSDGGRMLKGPGDGMSDSIPAVIGKRQPARLADGEFVVPADVVSHLGNGSTDAGAKKLYGMMDKIRKARTGKKKQAPAVKADKYMPA